jgi:hypothetical protein
MSFGGPNQTATPLPVQDFTPQKNYPAFSVITNQYYNPVAYTATATTLTYSDVLGGYITSSNAAAQALTLPTAALLVPQIQGGQGGLPGIAPPSATSGSGIRFFVTALGAGTITVAVGTGGTLATGSTATIATGQIKEFLLVITKVGDLTSTPTYTLYSLGTSTQ